MSDRPPLVEVLLRQRQAWESGERPPVEVFLERFAHLRDDDDAVLDLIYQETVLREAAGETVSAGEYVARFPHLEALLRVQFEVEQALTLERFPDALTATGLPRLEGCEIHGEVGRGAMGVVYRGWQAAARRPVAVKVLSADVPAGRVRAEAAAASRLLHTNIVQLFEVKEYDGRPALVMEYVEGGSLDEKLAGKPQPPPDAARLVETLAWAMAYAHGRGVIHRDLKPSNVLLSAGPDEPLRVCVPKVGDFGVAKFLEGGPPLTATNELLGTPSYMAPELTGGAAAADASADVYALGAILYECLTGRPPFLGETPLGTLEQVRHQDPVPPSRLQPRLPRDLEVICLKCLHKSPARRYATAREPGRRPVALPRRRPDFGARPAGRLELPGSGAPNQAAAALVLVCGGGGRAGRLAAAAQPGAAGKRDLARGTLRKSIASSTGPGGCSTPRYCKVGSVWEETCPGAAACWRTRPPARPTCAASVGRSSTGSVRLPPGHPRPGLGREGGRPPPERPTANHRGGVRRGDPLGRCHWADDYRLAGHDREVTAVAVSGDGLLLATADAGGAVRLWDMPGGSARPVELRRPRRRSGLAPGQQNPRRCQRPGDDVDAAPSAAGLLRGETHPLTGVAVSPNGQLIAAGGPDDTVRLWTRTGKPGGVMRGHAAPATCFAFTRDCRDWSAAASTARCGCGTSAARPRSTTSTLPSVP
ncbi:MAG: serine/threonine-protein kinase [Gemmataceae bacterium]